MNQNAENLIFHKVLVIDDNETDRYIADFSMHRYKFAEEVVLQDSGRKALEYLLSLENATDELPEFIFLDIRMPMMDGFEFLEEYEKLPEVVKKTCVIMMLSTSLNPADHKRAESNPYVKKFLTKPLDKDKMDELKQEFLRG
ncbi:MAG: response regulator [Bacteroidetes bacterium]|nr:response regulator [Bacteroidota bacterium]